MTAFIIKNIYFDSQDLKNDKLAITWSIIESLFSADCFKKQLFILILMIIEVNNSMILIILINVFSYTKKIQ